MPGVGAPPWRSSAFAGTEDVVAELFEDGHLHAEAVKCARKLQQLCAAGQGVDHVVTSVARCAPSAPAFRPRWSNTCPRSRPTGGPNALRLLELDRRTRPFEWFG